MDLGPRWGGSSELDQSLQWGRAARKAQWDCVSREGPVSSLSSSVLSFRSLNPTSPAWDREGRVLLYLLWGGLTWIPHSALDTR